MSKEVNEKQQTAWKYLIAVLLVPLVFGAVNDRVDDPVIEILISVLSLGALLLIIRSFNRKVKPGKGNLRDLIRSKDAPYWIKMMMIGCMGLVGIYFVYFFIFHVITAF